jgi:prepilin-type N-terminal cleavage/methylation domain-containing protein
MDTPRSTAAAGFTLVESMIALFLVSFIVSQMALVTISATRSTQYAKQVTKANMYADEALEKSRNTAYANLQQPVTGLAETCVVAANVATCTSNAPLEGIYTRVRIVRPLDAANSVTTLAVSKKAQVVATVTFTDARGAAQRVSAASVMTSY